MGQRIPEHYTESWQVDPDFRGEIRCYRPAHRPNAPGHSSWEFARLLLQHWDLTGPHRPRSHALARARAS